MSQELLKLEPDALWGNFYSLTQIPRPSKHEEQIREFVKNFGEKLGLKTVVDEVGNVIIKKPATKGMENRKGVVLQGHLDMVPQKNSNTNHDFKKDPIQAYVDGEWVKAKGTTLGADNGIGVAAALAILESKDIAHGPIEALFTSDEETGMTGAFGLKAGMLDADILINMDSEDEGELYIGCAGGINTNAVFSYCEEAVYGGLAAFKISITGLKGGHSGVDIHLQRGNSNKIMFRFLYQVNNLYSMRLANILGGSLRNAIPREAFAVITIAKNQVDEFLAFAANYELIVKKELGSIEPDFKFEVTSTDLPDSLIDRCTSNRLIKAVNACPNGVMRMSTDFEGIVETSTNLAVIESKNGKITILNLLRSSVDSAKQSLAEMVESVFMLAGAKVEQLGAYPGWKPNAASPILQTMKDLYNKMYGKTPDVKVIHAGLECGLLGGVYPNWDMVSFGPTIRFPHSPDEKVNIETVKKFWDFLVETLKNIPVK